MRVVRNRWHIIFISTRYMPLQKNGGALPSPPLAAGQACLVGRVVDVPSGRFPVRVRARACATLYYHCSAGQLRAARLDGLHTTDLLLILSARKLPT